MPKHGILPARLTASAKDVAAMIQRNTASLTVFDDMFFTSLVLSLEF
jgi:hypothetical protein